MKQHLQKERKDNEARYEALIAGIKMALDARGKNLVPYSDSQQVTKQVEGEYEVKDERRKEYLQEIAQFLIGCSTHNITVRTLVKNSLKTDIATLQVETNCRKPLLDYLTEDILSANEMEATRLKSRASRKYMKAVVELMWRHGFNQQNLTSRIFWPTLKKEVISWAKKMRALPKACYAHSCSNRTFQSIIEPVIPAEAELETFRIQHYEQKNNNNLLRANLDLIDKVREDARTCLERYKQRIVNAYNQRVRKREFQVGDLVLRQAGALRPVGKLAPNWVGPYKITQIIKFGVYELEDIYGRNFLSHGMLVTSGRSNLDISFAHKTNYL
ncbi:hypothetical protein Sango_2475000 [Sesamum angolense]|uniref:RNase H type-1 domain-containing protein n=1 Tax=Sesamum angolense TaxID=2727404 RepID=A0AAE2BHX2_9LAMI|nr:hypothetical protein Sango_2475000 [Sesamum angolense]